MKDLRELRKLVCKLAEAEQALRAAIGGRSPAEGIGEWIARAVYEGTMAAANTKGFDVVAKDGRRVQAKARTAASPQFEHERSLSFDVSLCIWLSKDFSKVLKAWEVTPEAVRGSGRFSSKGDPMITETQLRRGGIGIRDVTSQAASVWL